MINKARNGVLYVVATPIGNLKDITLRALEILKEVDLIVCEDTRVTATLLRHYEIKTKMISFHQHSKIRRIDWIIDKLKNGFNLALVTDSGTPGISDPGSFLVKRAIDGKIKVIPIPGPSALSAVISVSGSNSKNIVFLGFLPKKKGRQKKFSEISAYLNKGLVVVIYESPYRIKKTLREISRLSDKLDITCFREITKKFEEIITVKLDGNEKEINKIRAQGEFTVVLKAKRK